MRQVDYGPSDGTDALTFDKNMRSIFQEETCVNFADGEYKTAMTPEWNRNRPERGFAMDGQIVAKNPGKVTIAGDPDAILDSDIEEEPQRLITGRGVDDRYRAAGVAKPVAPEDYWAELARNQAVKGVVLKCNHSLLVDRWKKAGKSLRTSAILLQGHNAAIESVDILDAGAWRADPLVGAETFPAAITGATAAGDASAIARLDPTKYKFDIDGTPSHITGSTFREYHPEASNDQVTVFMIVGSYGEANGWTKGDWRMHFRTDCYHDSNYVEASGKNLVQGYTLYLTEQGHCTNNTTQGADVGYYGDFLQTKNVTIELNQFLNCRHGASLYLSPAPTPIAEQFFHDGYTIGINKITSSGTNVSISPLHSGLPISAQRYIRNIKIHASLTLETFDTPPKAKPEDPSWEQIAGITRFGVDPNTKKGCALLFWRR